MRYDQLYVSVLANRKALGEQAAADVSAMIRQLLADKETINIIFAAAPSQNEFLATLRADPSVEWARINAYHMDEYLGLPADAPQGFGNFLQRGLFGHVNFRSVNYMNGHADYAALIASNPPDIVCMGIGENTHIAFNEPYQANFRDTEKLRVVELDPVCRQQQVNDGCFGAIEDVPLKAVTLTVPVLFGAAHLFCMVPGKTKARAVFHTLTEPVSEAYPSTILRTHADARLYLDKDSAALIPQNTQA